MYWRSAFSNFEWASALIQEWLDAADDWLTCPCSEHALAAPCENPAFGEGDLPPGGGYMADAGFAVVRMVGPVERFSARLPISNSRHGPQGRISREVLAAIQAELLPWCLGTGDPVRDRVEAREREAAGE